MECAYYFDFVGRVELTNRASHKISFYVQARPKAELRSGAGFFRYDRVDPRIVVAEPVFADPTHWAKTKLSLCTPAIVTKRDNVDRAGFAMKDNNLRSLRLFGFREQFVEWIVLQTMPLEACCP